LNRIFSVLFFLTLPTFTYGDSCSKLLLNTWDRSTHTLTEIYRAATNSPYKAIRALDKTKRTLIVVDGLSSGFDYARLARQLFGDINIIHIQSSPELPPGLKGSFHPEDYDALLVYTGRNLDFLTNLFKDFPKDRQ
jgi:hypothetical protein